VSPKELKAARDIVARFVEEIGADAVVVVYSRVKRQKTETFIVPYGNAHTCNALIDYAYESYEPPELELADDEDD
tara:strand:- start:963 stop:1187 length:225 start_codon:yes stop_codon:yes gene_type:complete